MIIKHENVVTNLYKGDKICFCMFKGENLIYGARSPYNSETTRILMTNFPQKFVEICEYGNMHPQIVPFVNEDPMLVCSLGIEGMPVRMLCNSAQCYINTPIVLTNETSKLFRVEFDAILHDVQNFSAWAIYGYDVPDFSLGMNSSGQFVMEGCSQTKNSGRNDRAYALEMMTYIGDYKNHYCYLKDKNGNTIYSLNCVGTKNNTFYGYGYRLFGSVTSSGGRGNLDCHSKLKGARLYINEEIVCNMYPFIRQGVNGMIDILTGMFYPNANTSGVFTIEYTLADGTPWYPTT